MSIIVIKSLFICIGIRKKVSRFYKFSKGILARKIFFFGGGYVKFYLITIIGVGYYYLVL